MNPSVTLTLLELVGLFSVFLFILIFLVRRSGLSEDDLKTHLDHRLDAIDRSWTGRKNRKRGRGCVRIEF